MKFFLTLLILSYFFHAKCSGESYKGFFLSTDVEKQMECIPKEERVYLEKFFRKLIISEGLGYTLFGTKPVCLSGYFLQVPVGNMLIGSDNFIIKNGWEIWKKYEHLFPHPNYLIFAENRVRYDTNIHPIYFINKKNTLKILQESYEIFKKELPNANFNPEKFLIHLGEKQSLSKMINLHEGLLGILLGYGAESSMQYQKRDLMWKSQPPIIYEEIHLQAVSENAFYENSILENIRPIQFVGDPQSLEVKAILEQNAKEREFLLHTFSQGEFLEITLRKLTEPNSLSKN